MSSPTVQILLHERDVHTFAAGETIFTKGDPGDKMYGVIEGSVDIVLNAKILETVEAGGVVGEIALIDTKPRSGTAIARTDCKLAAIDQKRFMILVAQNPWFSIQVMQVLADRLRRWGVSE